uniref:Aminopeptidase n=1 Tax=Globisporangium ultimum (strain ATCC 200006 / CBS 805.95 / DAOM BR144) TaxID=431595 RepID=K3WUF7_GLOUD
MASSSSKSFARLPTNVAPRKYYLDYHVDLPNYRFEVAQKIDVDVRSATRTITCHAVELYVFNVAIEYDGKKVECDEIRYLQNDQSIELLFAETIPAGTKAVIHLECHGFLNDKLKGFYRSEYEQDNEKRIMAVTQFEACDARRAFVCWDEPAVKASYEISIVTDTNLTAISNTHVVQTTIRPKKNAHIRANTRTDATVEKVWKFAETPIMSTYLVGMVVGEFDAVSDVTKEGVLVTVYTPVGRSERGLFALDVGTKALSFFTERFGIDYPLKKLDMLAIPDFAAGAMENWGVVTYRETRLLVDEKQSSFAQKTATARTVCHELAHQWFGNLVTMDWWTGLWLNEGFARFMEFEAVHHIFPEWNVWDTFVQEITMSTAMVKDCMKTSHPIEVVVNHPDEVDQIFDVISYAKGASIIRMLSEYLGRDVFYKGIHAYLVKFSYRNAQTEDLWNSLEEASGQKITKMANSWTSQTGYPIVTFNVETKELTQERFFADKSFKDEEKDAAVWDVPLTYLSSDSPSAIQQAGIWQAKSTQDGACAKTPLTADAETAAKLVCPSSGDGAWIKVNPKQSGFYLVNYSPQGWNALQKPVREKVFDTVDRMSLLNSVFAFARAGVLPVSQALDFSNAYADEPEHLCWKEISANLGFYSALFKEESFYPLLQQYIRNLFAGVMARLTWEAAPNESTVTGHFRRDVIAMLSRGDDHAVVAEAKRLFHAYFAGGRKSLAADLRGVVFDIQASRGDTSHMKQLRQCYEESDFIEEKLNCLSAIGLFKSLEIKREVIEWALKNVRSQDIQYVFASVASDMDGAVFAWQYVQDNWAALNAQYAPLMVGRIVLAVISRFQSEAKACEVESFLRDRKHNSYERLLDASLERIRIKSASFQRDRDELAKWLAATISA